MFDYYIEKAHFNAKHSFSGDVEEAHGHSFTMVCYIGMRGSENAEHRVDEKSEIKLIIDSFADSYRDKYLNELEEFCGRENTLELLGDVFFEKLRALLAKRGHCLYQLDISENPLCVYQVSDRILLPTLNMGVSGENYKKIFAEQDKMLNMTGSTGRE
jgi:6-pyruvoyltetrahydropterin/6-carboxytetrahydropterin synthase